MYFSSYNNFNPKFTHHIGLTLFIVVWLIFQSICDNYNDNIIHILLIVYTLIYKNKQFII